MSTARPRPDVGELLWCFDVDCGGDLLPVPTGKFVSDTLLSGCLCRHIPALSVSRLQTPIAQVSKGLPTLSYHSGSAQKLSFIVTLPGKLTSFPLWASGGTILYTWAQTGGSLIIQDSQVTLCSFWTFQDCELDLCVTAGPAAASLRSPWVSMEALGSGRHHFGFILTST